MKKTILTLITVLLLVMAFTVTVSAAGTTATTESKNGAKGDTVTVNVSVTSTSNVTSGAVEVTYDSTKLQLVDGSWSVSGSLLANFDKSNGKGAFAFATGSTVDGNILSVKFKVLTDAPLGDTDVQCKIMLKNGSTDLPVTNKAGKITVTCKHSFTKKTTDYLASEASCISGPKYYYTCSICGEKGDTTFVQGEPSTHNYNKKVTTSDYLVKSVKCVNTAEYYYSCECGKKGTEKFSADASWSHSFSEKLMIDNVGHWYGCSDCGEKKSYSNHTLKSGVCSTCNFVSTQGAPEHVHAYAPSWVANATGHWHECSCGEKKDFAEHTGTTCSVCKYSTVQQSPEHVHAYAPSWVTDANGHWHECSCGEKKDFAAHTGTGSCSVCGFHISATEHVHQYSQSWSSNEAGHWHLCECGEKGDIDVHAYGEWTVNGNERSRKCSACDFVDTETIPSGNIESKSNELLVGILSAVGAIALVIGVECIIYFVKKKSKVKNTVEEPTEKTEE